MAIVDGFVDSGHTLIMFIIIGFVIIGVATSASLQLSSSGGGSSLDCEGCLATKDILFFTNDSYSNTSKHITVGTLFSTFSTIAANSSPEAMAVSNPEPFTFRAYLADENADVWTVDHYLRQQVAHFPGGGLINILNISHKAELDGLTLGNQDYVSFLPNVEDDESRGLIMSARFDAFDSNFRDLANYETPTLFKFMAIPTDFNLLFEDGNSDGQGNYELLNLKIDGTAEFAPDVGGGSKLVHYMGSSNDFNYSYHVDSNRSVSVTGTAMAISSCGEGGALYNLGALYFNGGGNPLELVASDITTIHADANYDINFAVSDPKITFMVASPLDECDHLWKLKLEIMELSIE